MGQVGLSNIRNKPREGDLRRQKRPLGLALELVSNPTLLLCDEVTSGLDPKAEREIVHLMHGLAQHEKRVVINVTHSLSNLELYDTVLVIVPGLHRVPRPAAQAAPLLQRRTPGGGLPAPRQALLAQLARVLGQAPRFVLRGIRLGFRRPCPDGERLEPSHREARLARHPDARRGCRGGEEEEEEDDDDLDGDETRKLEEKLRKRREQKKRRKKRDTRDEEDDEDPDDDDDDGGDDGEPEQLWDDDSPAETPGPVAQFLFC